MGDELETTRPKRSVVVVEDNALIRSLVANLLEGSNFEVQTAANALDAKRAVRVVDPDAAIIDINLGDGPDGFDVAQALRKQNPELAIVFLTSQPDPRFSGKSQDAVVKNAVYLNKSILDGTDALLQALEAALLERDTAKFRHDLLESRPFANLNKSQLQVLRWIAEGKTNQQIAELRKRSLTATESLIARTLQALGIERDAGLNARVAAAVKFISDTHI